MTTTIEPTPITFVFDTPIYGNGLTARVRMLGRALLDEAGDETWITGVAPAGIAAPGSDAADALSEFRRAWTEVLLDVADRTRGFDEFRDEERRFLSATVDHLTEHGEELMLRRGQGEREPAMFEVVEAGLEALKLPSSRPSEGIGA